MNDNPNGTRWLKSENNLGRSLLLRNGWTEGSGLGKEKDGVTSHVKVRQKDGTMGIGYAGCVQETWSAQSVAFADVLERIKAAVSVDENDTDGEDCSQKTNNSDEDCASDNGKTSKPRGGRHASMYAKRHALRTEFLRAKDEKYSKEILGSASSSHKWNCDRDGSENLRGDGHDDARESSCGDGCRRPKRKRDTSLSDRDSDTASTLRSAVLQRLMVRTPRHEPRHASNRESGDRGEDERDCYVDSSGNTVRVVKPHPRPPKCTDTPFLECS